jgi:hypothetical protein
VIISPYSVKKRKARGERIHKEKNTMTPTISAVAAGIAAVYLSLRFVLYITQYSKEPPTVLTGIPFVSPLLGMIREKSDFYLRIRFAIILATAASST